MILDNFARLYRKPFVYTLEGAVNARATQTGPPGTPLLFVPVGTTDTIVLSVDDYALIEPDFQAVLFDDPTTPVVFDDFAAFSAALEAVPSLNDLAVIGTPEKGYWIGDKDTWRKTLNRVLTWFGLPIVGGWDDLQYFTDGEYFTY